MEHGVRVLQTVEWRKLKYYTVAMNVFVGNCSRDKLSKFTSKTASVVLPHLINES